MVSPSRKKNRRDAAPTTSAASKPVAAIPAVISPWLDTKEAADYLGLSAGTLHVMRCKKEGPKIHLIGTRIRYRVEDLDEFVLQETAKGQRREGKSNGRPPKKRCWSVCFPN